MRDPWNQLDLLVLAIAWLCVLPMETIVGASEAGAAAEDSEGGGPIEALNALYVAKKKLKLGWGASLGWAAAALAVGVASLGRLNRLANARALAGSFAGKQE